MLSDMKWENVPMRPQQIKIRSKYVEKKIDSKSAYMASVFFLCRWLCGILLDGCMYIWVWACVVGAFFYSDHVTYRREKRLRRKMLDQVHIALSLRPGSSHSEAGLMSCLPEKPGAGAGPLQRPWKTHPIVTFWPMRPLSSLGSQIAA